MAKLKTVEFNGWKVPVIPNIHQTIYAAASQPGALDMNNWHTCKSTHCRAGWVVTLAGKAGRELARSCCSTGDAAFYIYRASDPSMRFGPDWYGSDSDALADMKRLAKQEAKKQKSKAD